MAEAFGLRPPAVGTWIEQLQQVAEQLPHAMVICDMCVPGVKVQYANPASERLTGYTKVELVGRNCRFMQGKRTEAAAVRVMVRAIRSAEQVTLRVTNYKKGGVQFVNMLTLHPVKDSLGVYRYSIGIMSDSADETQKDGLAKLREVLPAVLDMPSQPVKFDNGVTTVVEATQREQFRLTMARLSQLVWSTDWITSLRRMLSHPRGEMAFKKWLQSNSPKDIPDLELYLRTEALDNLEEESSQSEALDLCELFMGKAPSTGEGALLLLRDRAARAISSISESSFPQFVQSQAVRSALHLACHAAGGAVLCAPVLWRLMLCCSARIEFPIVCCVSTLSAVFAAG